MRARHRLSKLLLRYGIVYNGGKAWTGRHDVWLRHDALPQLSSRATRLAFDAGYEEVLTVTARRDRLDAEIEQLAADSEFTPLVRRLGCLRGIGTLTGFALAVEIGDWHRFTGNSIGSFVGLVPAEYSSGSSRSQGPITKTGNGHARRLLVEAAWHHRARYQLGKALRDRWALAPAAARDRGDQGNRRLHDRWIQFLTCRKRHTVAGGRSHPARRHAPRYRHQAVSSGSSESSSGRISFPGRRVEPIGVAVHLAWVQVPAQVQRRGDAGMPHDLLEHLGRVARLDHQRGSGVPRPVMIIKGYAWLCAGVRILGACDQGKHWKSRELAYEGR